MKKTIFIISGILVLLIVGALFRKDLAQNYSQVLFTKEEPPNLAQSQSGAIGTIALPPSASVPQISNFLKEEGKLLESLKVDSEAALQRMQAAALSLGKEDMEYLAGLVVKGEASAAERILGVSLLLEAGPKAWPSLDKIVLPPFGQSRPAPHTVEEAKNMQEKALRVMAADRLAEAAKADPEARLRLESWGREAADVGLRQYILNKLRDIPSP